MWILIKLVLAGSVFLFRLSSRTFRLWIREETRGVEGVPLNIISHTRKNRVVSTSFEVEFQTYSFAKLSVESHWDRMFKKMGLANEIQTNDEEFDARVYVASDSSAFRRHITLTEKTRMLALELFGLGANHIVCDGHCLRVNFPGDQLESLDLQERFVAFFKELRGFETTRKGLLHDPFAIKVVLIEAIVWGLGAYSFLGFLSWELNLYLNYRALVVYGLALGLILCGLIFLLIVMFLKGSSRGHRILIESFLVLALSIPLGGITICSDINRSFDRSPSTTVLAQVTDLRHKSYRRRGFSRGHVYYMTVVPLSPVSPSIKVPQIIQVDSSFYRQLSVGSEVRLEVSPGRLGLKWFSSMSLVGRAPTGH